MAYIYQIVNDINNKIYIGKTEFSIEKRFKEHCRDALKERNEQRPLYAAMRKYGVEHFYIELIEETDFPEEREKFWIEQKNSFKYGYNATIGGDGKPYLDYDLIVSVYKQTQSIAETAKICKCNTSSVSHVLDLYNIKKQSGAEVSIQKYGKIVHQYDLDNNYLNSFPSTHAAATFLNKKGVSHIADACKGKRQTAYGYKWKYDT